MILCLISSGEGQQAGIQGFGSQQWPLSVPLSFASLLLVLILTRQRK